MTPPHLQTPRGTGRVYRIPTPLPDPTSIQRNPTDLPPVPPPPTPPRMDSWFRFFRCEHHGPNSPWKLCFNFRLPPTPARRSPHRLSEMTANRVPMPETSGDSSSIRSRIRRKWEGFKTWVRDLVRN